MKKVEIPFEFASESKNFYVFKRVHSEKKGEESFYPDKLYIRQSLCETKAAKITVTIQEAK